MITQFLALREVLSHGASRGNRDAGGLSELELRTWESQHNKGFGEEIDAQEEPRRLAEGPLNIQQSNA